MSEQIVVLVNPAAGGGRAAARVPPLRDALIAAGIAAHHIVLRETHRTGEETAIAHSSAADGARVVIVVGGDGSVSRAAAGLMHTGTALAVCSAGTGNDFVKSLYTKADAPDALAARIAAGRTRTIDMGMVDDVPFVNAAGFGFDVHVLQHMQQRQSRWLAGTAAYVVTALRALTQYRGVDAAVHTKTHTGAPHTRHQAPMLTSRRLMLVFANGRHFGGAFRIAPQAQLDDGALDAVLISDVPVRSRLPLFAAAIRGTHGQSAFVTQERAAEFTIASDQPLAFEADGELYPARGTLVRITTRPRALTIFG